ncbi:MAG: hypothetical protein RIC15_00160 [Vicingaceae bacterium]
MKRSKLFLLSAFAMISWLSSCYYDVEEELYPVGCDTSSVSYSNDVVPVLVSSCYSCHAGAAPTGGASFDDHASLTSVMGRTSAQFFCRIKFESGCNPMPQGGNKLSDCSILKLETWYANGAANN